MMTTSGCSICLLEVGAWRLAAGEDRAQGTESHDVGLAAKTATGSGNCGHFVILVDGIRYCKQ